jgi:hypothetical protein
LIGLKKGQGTFEYVLLLAGVLLIVVLAIVLLRGGIFGGGAKDVSLQACKAELAKSSGCYSGSSWLTSGYKPTEANSACAAFITSYSTYVQSQTGSCPSTATAGKDLDYNTSGYCCGTKPA